jgi:hypothetical protein
MNRRDLLKGLAAAAVACGWGRSRSAQAQAPAFASRWEDWPDVLWAGPHYWANRLQDWRIAGGSVECLVAGRNRTLHCLTHRLAATDGAFTATVTIERAGLGSHASAADCVGFRLGAKGPRDDYRSAAVYGTGLDVGLTTSGHLRVGDLVGQASIAARRVRLHVSAEPRPDGRYRLVLGAADPSDGRLLASLQSEATADVLIGNVALLSHVDANDDPASSPAARFSSWEMSGQKIVHAPEAAFGPVCFAQYTLHRGTLKLTAQLTPIEAIAGHRIFFEVRDGADWRVAAEPALEPLSRTAHVRVEGWRAEADVPYRLRVVLPLANGPAEFTYAGTIAREPADRSQLRVACFSCNADHGFPDADVVRHVAHHRPDVAVFLGDQYYESHGGFGIQTSPIEKASLDYLRKWYMFGWSYRDLFRHIPAAMIPDDHDVYHGNIWGDGGVAAPTDQGWGYPAQDQGGYKMPAAWVNPVQRSQTSHLPDPYDPTPVAQGIGVYYTHWNYAGLSFAILEDRKFKSAPGRVLPEEARVVNGFPTNLSFDVRQHPAPPGAHLLGERQQRFLEAWSDGLSDGAIFKIVLSQSPFCAPHTLPAGSTGDQAVPRLPIPAPGEYVAGDAPACDMDTNGWPQNGRNDAVRALRGARALHLAGDQHLATVIQYGVDDFGDAGFVFTGPALNCIWPRRWWPTLPPDHQPLPGRAPYTGNFLDAFGNRMTMYAAANPRQTGRQPAIIHDRATGYGIVIFDKATGDIRIECWPRGTDPAADPDGQYDGWPITIRDGRIVDA